MILLGCPRAPFAAFHGNRIFLITQIYEIQNPDEVDPVCAAGVDHIGSVILSEEDWQQPLIRETVQTVQNAGKKSALIPLFSDPATVFQALDYYRPDIVHFCEMLSLEFDGLDVCHRLIALQQEIRTRYPEMAIMRSMPIGRPNASYVVHTLALSNLFQPVSDFFLTDTVLSTGPTLKDQPVEGFVGITGRTCHWEIARDLVAHSETKVILAGGLSPDNVYDGIRFVKPVGVDSCTLTNRLDDQGHSIRFQKDIPRVRRFVDEARRAAADLLSTGI